MRVLITGGYGFIGSFVAEMFFREGHEVHIIDNLATGNKENARFSHILYQIGVEDPKCEEIFKTIKFDAVIHLAAQVNVNVSMEDPLLDCKFNILGLANMLRLASKYGVNKVVFASSAAVYGLNEEVPLSEESSCSPISPYGLNKWVGEMYCQKWKEIYGVDTLCFRFSNVYGPRQGAQGEGGVISTFIQKVQQGEELTVFGDGEQSRDFIYVQDVAEAIYLSVEKGLSGIYNLSTNIGVSVNSVIEALGRHVELNKVNYEQSRQGDVKHSRLENQKIKDELKWKPLHTFQEGLEKTYLWFEEKEPEQAKKEVKKKSAEIPEWIKHLEPALPYVKNIGLLILFVFISSLTEGFLYLVDYQLFYLVMALFLFRKPQAILTIVLASAWFIAESLSLGRNLFGLMLDYNTLVHISLYIFTGLVLRYVLEHQENLISKYKEEAVRISENYQLLDTAYKDTMLVKDELQRQIFYAENSVGTVYSIMKTLDTLNPLEVYHNSIHIIEKLMDTNQAAFYLFQSSENIFRLASKSEGFESEAVIRTDHHEVYGDVVKSHNLYVNKQLDNSLPSMIVPLVRDGKLTGIFIVDGLPFEKVSLPYINMMGITADLVSSSLNCAQRHQSAIYKNRW
ncbi:NAD-dependent epimerase/dehydratase family protein [Bacillus sp. AK031]